MSAAPLPPERLAEIVASLPPHPAPGTLVRGLHETVAEIDRLTTKLDRSEAESRMWRGTAWAEANTVWSSELPPGGLVCADPECGQPVESEPCEEHNPRAVAERLTARVAALLAERHSTNEALSDAAEAIRAKDQRIAEMEAKLHAVGMTRTWRMENGKKFVYVEDVTGVLFDTEPETHEFIREYMGESDAKRRLAKCKCGQARNAACHTGSGDPS